MIYPDRLRGKMDEQRDIEQTSWVSDALTEYYDFVFANCHGYRGLNHMAGIAMIEHILSSTTTEYIGLLISLYAGRPNRRRRSGNLAH